MLASFSVIYVFLFICMLFLFINIKESNYVYFEDRMKDIINILELEKAKKDDYYFHPFYVAFFKVFITAAIIVMYNYPRFLTSVYLMSYFLWLGYLIVNKPYRNIADNIFNYLNVCLTIFLLIIFMILITKYQEVRMPVNILDRPILFV